MRSGQGALNETKAVERGWLPEAAAGEVSRRQGGSNVCLTGRGDELPELTDAVRRHRSHPGGSPPGHRRASRVTSADRGVLPVHVPPHLVELSLQYFDSRLKQHRVVAARFDRLAVRRSSRRRLTSRGNASVTVPPPK